MNVNVLDKDGGGELWEQFLGLIRTGVPYGKACRAVHFTRQAMDAYLSLHPERAAELMNAESETIETVEQVAFEMASSGESETATFKWLALRDRERWSPASTGSQTGSKIVTDPAKLKELAAAEAGADVTDAEVIEGTTP